MFLLCVARWMGDGVAVAADDNCLALIIFFDDTICNTTNDKKYHFPTTKHIFSEMFLYNLIETSVLLYFLYIFAFGCR